MENRCCDLHKNHFGETILMNGRNMFLDETCIIGSQQNVYIQKY